MSFGIGVFLVALGAILTFATHLSVSGIDIDTVGVILMLVGVFWLVLAFSMSFRRRRTVVRQRRRPDPTVANGGDVVEERTYEDPVEPYERY